MNIILKLYIVNIIIDLFLSKLLNLYFSFNYFQSVPYMRAANVILTTLLLLIEFKGKLINPFKFNKNFFSDKLILYILLMNLIASLNGLFNRNLNIYFLSDFIYFLWGITLYRYTFSLNKNNDTNLFIFKRKFLFINFIFILIMIIINSFALTLVCSMIPLFFISIKSKKFNLALPYLFINLYLLHFTNRTFVLAFILVWFVLAFRFKEINRFIFLTIILLGISPLMISFLNLNVETISRGRFTAILRMIESGEIEYDISIAQRIEEVAAVYKELKAHFLYLLIGKGLGSTLNMEWSKDLAVIEAALLGSDKVHNIHILPFSLLFRYGILGIILFLFLIIYIIKSIKLYPSARAHDEFFVLLFITLFIYSITASSVLWTNPFTWISIGIIGKIESRHRLKCYRKMSEF